MSACRTFHMAIIGCLFATSALAQGVEERLSRLETSVSAAQSAGDNAWMLMSAALVLLMTGPGLALFYGGLVRKKNVLATMMQSFSLMAVITVLWALYGYSIAFSEGTPFFGGTSYLFLRGVGMEPNADYAATIPQQTFMVFQLMFAIITPALITGAFAERMKFSAMLIFMVLWATFVYFPLAHMVWGKGGFLNAALGGRVPALDFAGGTVVHISSGFSALVCAIILGRRLGYPKVPMLPHNMVLTFIGACLLWVGWFGFNAGSALSSNGLAANAFVVTHFAAASAALGWMFAEWIRHGKPTVLGALSGAVAGLVGITPASGFVTPMAALIIGVVASVGCFLMVTEVKKRFGYDDSLDVFGVHGTGGTIGALLTGVFATKAINPIFKDSAGNPLPVGLVDGNAAQVLNQLIGVIVSIALAIVGSFIILKVLDSTIGLRVSEDDEVTGLDLTQHGEEGYNLDLELTPTRAIERNAMSTSTAASAAPAHE
ncbi:ammonium transporter (TC 1.A.11) [Pyrinomonas methylaliphatogenes]|uniref:Ammonium transporter n=2 Tax=Pyrinomonas methylaliphatogenes TaxID=454194 RepID=A0A0B6X3D0_9BACT|nr:ammonium transporter (TC 1.A.11) [Pyrinomonas methylaliphatogenes]